MKILIAYASKTGTAMECAELLKRELKGQDVTVADLKIERPDPTAFDLVILGSSVRYGKARGELRAYLQAKRETLLRVPHGFFLCCGFGHEFERYVEKIFDEKLRASSFATLNFGGLLKLKNAGWVERVILNRVRADIRESEIEDGEYTPTLPSILPENISMMASFVRRELSRIKDKQ